MDVPMLYVVRDDRAELNAPLGGKARALAALRDAGFPIPAWLVVLPRAFDDVLGEQRLQRLQHATTAEQMRSVLEGVELSDPVLDELRRSLADLTPDGSPVAVRSSASDEDGAQHSFAGQLDSYLFVPAEQAAARVVDVWRSGFSDRVVAYRREHGLSLMPHPPAVLIQRMVNADSAGVAFGADPVNGRRGVAVISAVFGLGTALVGGDSDADTWHVDRDGKVVERHVATKKTAHAADPGSTEGVKAVPVPAEKTKTPALSDQQAVEVAELARRAGAHFGRPQDVEWAVEKGKLFLLQSRPITSLATQADPDGILNLWDNSNIAESYNGITTPLTFSFARGVYEEVYRQFCRLLSVPEAVIDQNAGVFRRMLGLVRGTVYYNLLNWYRLLAMLPGFKANRGFMEQMMGVKEPLPESLVAELGTAGWMERMRDRFRLAGSVLALVRQHFALPRNIKKFHARLAEALGPSRPDLTRRRPDEIVAHYRGIESKLLTKWDAPLVNDFFAMIFFGVLGKLTRQWCGDENGTLHNDLIGGEGGMISAEPAQRVRALAELARPRPDLVKALCEGTLRQVESVSPPEFRRLLNEYLDKFGDRCLEELKLESPTLFDDPTLLLRSVGQLARRSPLTPPGPPSPTKGRGREKDTPGGGATSAPSGSPSPLVGEGAGGVRGDAEARVTQSLRGHPLRRLLFRWVLKHARARVRDRENLRFERTRLFGRVRMMVAELGRQFHALNLLDDPRDVFYLEVGEILEYVEGTASTADLRGLAAVRKAEFDGYRKAPRPADRFTTRGLVYVGHDYQRTTAAKETAGGDERSGLGCCPGVVRGKVRVITDPRGAELLHGEILVAERTDPGWIMLFPSAAGLLVERGSLLSHSAIVAREMGIPAVVSIPDVTRWLSTGDEVELDGARGVVRRLAQAGESSQPDAPAREPQ
jgi:phosphohistidine swiveling domain-containing protein